MFLEGLLIIYIVQLFPNVWQFIIQNLKLKKSKFTV